MIRCLKDTQSLTECSRGARDDVHNHISDPQNMSVAVRRTEIQLRQEDLRPVEKDKKNKGEELCQEKITGSRGRGTWRIP